MFFCCEVYQKCYWSTINLLTSNVFKKCVILYVNPKLGLISLNFFNFRDFFLSKLVNTHVIGNYTHIHRGNVDEIIYQSSLLQ